MTPPKMPDIIFSMYLIIRSLGQSSSFSKMPAFISKGRIRQAKLIDDDALSLSGKCCQMATRSLGPYPIDDFFVILTVPLNDLIG